MLTYFLNWLDTWVLLSGPAECAERSAAPPQVAPRAKSEIKVLAKYLQAKDAQLQKPRSPDYPLSFSLPRAPHIPPGRPQDLRLIVFVGHFFDFFAFQNGLQNLLRKIIEKNAKIEDFGLSKPSQNPSKTLPKSMFPKTYNFSSIFARKMTCCKSANIKKTCAHAVFC